MTFAPARALFVVLAGVIVTAGTACGSEQAEPELVRVPEDHASIQAAVDAAAPGDMVLIGPGTYPEAVTIRTRDVTVRGLDRNAVVLDGGHELADGIVVTADGVTVENLTVRNYAQTGVLVTGEGTPAPERDTSGADASGTETPGTPPASTVAPTTPTRSTVVAGADTTGADADPTVVGFRVAYVTVSNNGLDGVAAFTARDGEIDHVYASGHPDAGISIARCDPCNAVVGNSVAEYNAVGLSVSAASGSLFVVNNVFRANRVGIAPGAQEFDEDETDPAAVFAGNAVADNDNPAAPAVAGGLFGVGIAVGGGSSDTMLRNRVTGHDAYGIGLRSADGSDPIGNRVEGNVLAGNGVDLYFELRPGAVATFDNCFTTNEFASSIPERIEEVMSCDVPAGPFVPQTLRPPESPPAVDYRTISAPGAQQTMPGDLAIPPGPSRRPESPDLDAIVVPGG